LCREGVQSNFTPSPSHRFSGLANQGSPKGVRNLKKTTFVVQRAKQQPRERTETEDNKSVVVAVVAAVVNIMNGKESS
jgi:hypothetical protein